MPDLVTDFPRSPIAGLVGPNNEPIYGFDSWHLQEQVNKSIANLGPDKAFATINVEQRRADGEKVIRVVGAYRLGEHWSVGGVYEHTKAYDSAALGVRLHR